MPNKCGLSNRHCRRVRFGVSSLISLGLASVMLWGLVTVKQPEANLYKLNLRNVNENLSTIYLEMELINPNPFRGFNYTYGWVELFYLSNNESWEITWDYIPEEYQGFKKSLHWNFTLNATDYDFWGTYSPLLKTQQGHIYVSLYLAYHYKILSWTTDTTYHQWLDAHAYVNNSFNLKEVYDFNRTKDLTLALST